ncbi:MFS transporter [Viridibacillus sp. YIM B01967]|uniref:MFS transporter n=1 Tax=Viridibacillus soli TaxID=2798301 RepID=A0ABS1HC51_9BACL|nr:MFS transporter [Viridibacillus soli]MBK3497015.1 MFS transporter [Viridibacillus soli]
MQSKMNKALYLVLANLLVVFLGIGLVVPVLPTLMREMHLSGATMGYLIAAFACVQLVVSPIAGRWVDRFGRKKMIVIGMMIFGFSELLFGFGQDVKVLYASRMLGGISAAFIMPAVTAYVADVTTLKQRSKAMGYVAAAINTGFIIGPGIGGFLAELNTRLPFFFAAGLGFCGAIFSLLFLKETASTQEGQNETAEVKTKPGFKKVLEPIYLIPMLIILVSSFGLATYETVYGLYLDHQFGFTAKDIALLITISGILGTITQVFAFDRLTSWLGEIRLIRVCLAVAAVFMIAMMQVSAYALVLAVTLVIFLTFDLIRPALTTYLSKVAGNEQGFVGGLNSTFTSVGNIIGPAVAGILFDINVHYPYGFAMVVLAISYAMAFFWKKPQQV